MHGIDIAAPPFAAAGLDGLEQVARGLSDGWREAAREAADRATEAEALARWLDLESHVLAATILRELGLADRAEDVLRRGIDLTTPGGR